MNMSDYAEATKRTMRATVKKLYKVENGGHEHPEKVRFVSLTKKKATRVGEGKRTCTRHVLDQLGEEAMVKAICIN